MCGKQTAEAPPGAGVTGGTKGIRDACLSKGLRRGGRPVDVYLAVIALLENVTPFHYSARGLILIHELPRRFSHTLKDNGGVTSRRGGGFAALTFSRTAGSRPRSEMRELHL